MASNATLTILSKNNKGSTSLFFVLSLIVLTSLFYLGLLYTKKHIFLHRRYISAYKCMKHVKTAHYFQTEKLLLSNKLIISLNVIGLLPQVKASTKSLKKLIQFGQEIIYLNYINSISLDEFCSIQQVKNYLNPTPFKRKNMMFFKREKDGTIKITKQTYKKKIWFKQLKTDI